MIPAASAGSPPRPARPSRRRRPGAPLPPPASGPGSEPCWNEREALILLRAALQDATDAFAALADRDPWPTTAALRARCARYALVLRATTPPARRPA
jgi:hypothetical protein